MIQRDTNQLELPAMAYGCWRLADDAPTSRQVAERIDAALDAGMTLLDTADIYGHGTAAGFGGAEALLGVLLRSRPELRTEIVLATKGGIVPGAPYDQSPTYLRNEACEASLQRLNTDVIDLYFVHRPDVLTGPAELAETLDALIDDGLVRSVGLSNFSAAHTRAVAAHLTHPLAAIQPEWSLGHLDPLGDGTFALATELGAAVLAWSPLAGGSLIADVPNDARTPAGSPPLATELARVALRHDATPSAVALAWLMALPGPVIPIVGTQTPERIREAAKAAEIVLDRSDFYSLLEAARGVPLP